MPSLIGLKILKPVLDEAGITLGQGTSWVTQGSNPGALKRRGHYGSLPVWVYYCTLREKDASVGVYVVDEEGLMDVGPVLFGFSYVVGQPTWVQNNCQVAEYLTGR